MSINTKFFLMNNFNLTGDLYLQIVNNIFGDPIQTSIQLYNDIKTFINCMGHENTYGEISYV
ncbi:hypothetical protein BpHYR1_006471 [Brachionus plicatilis]|uniref:Uncharacterized protein n=1 Tax=Brachionus plicatilis TaxID=10195 RepID=A0A3M7PVE9_BRAPC|nr:hypothetical protein BpHYR1_006471 [Brachionus plicatilis]